LQGRRSWRTIRILTGQIVDLRFRWVARQAEEAAGTLALRERAKSALLTLGGEQRRIIQEATSRLVASRQLGRPEDVDFLSDRELDAMLLGAPPPPAAAMHSRRSVARRTASAPPLPEIFAGSPGVAAVEDIAAGRALAGWPASSGWVTATARVVGDIVDASRLRRGDILVASATDPSWTPIILDAGAVVLETGGPLSHAALVAREFGIPAVLRVNGATRIIEDGEPLEVDGYAGLVTRVDYEEAKPP
jgi:pyruvate,water dikinase